MKKRVVAVLCTIMMASGMLAGCGQANSHSEKSGIGGNGNHILGNKQ